jgi:hypothetical protein
MTLVLPSSGQPGGEKGTAGTFKDLLPLPLSESLLSVSITPPGVDFSMPLPGVERDMCEIEMSNP